MTFKVPNNFTLCFNSRINDQQKINADNWKENDWLKDIFWRNANFRANKKVVLIYITNISKEKTSSVEKSGVFSNSGLFGTFRAHYFLSCTSLWIFNLALRDRKHYKGTYRGGAYIRLPWCLGKGSTTGGLRTLINVAARINRQ